MNKCLGLFDGGVPCDNDKHPNRGDYCNSCWKNKRRPPCKGYNLSTDKACPYKAKQNGYCGNHKDFEKPRCEWIVKEGKKDEWRCTLYKTHGNFCDAHFKMDKAREIKASTTYEMEITKIETKIYGKEEYETMERTKTYIKERKEEAYAFRNQLLQREMSKKEQNLLVIKFPESIEEWDYITNKDVDICKISRGTYSKYSWVCPKNSEHPAYCKSVNNQVRSKKCKECRMEALGRGKEVREKEVKFMRERVVNPQTNTIIIGEETEMFVTNMLRNLNIYQSVMKLGELSGDSDVEIIHKDENINYIQIKTLTKDGNKHTFTLKDYPENMLIVGVDRKREKFFLAFAGEYEKGAKIALTFSYPESIYKDKMYTNLEDFQKRLIELVPKSVQENILYETNKKEYKSLKRLSEECTDRGLLFKRNTTNRNAIDAYINGIKIQAKYSTKKKNSNKFSVTISKHGGMFNGRKLSSPYDEDDFHLVVELGNGETDPEKYHGIFCVIPMKILVEKGLTENCDGKTSFAIHPPDSHVNHWTKQFWNNFSVFEQV